MEPAPYAMRPLTCQSERRGDVALSLCKGLQKVFDQSCTVFLVSLRNHMLPDLTCETRRGQVLLVMS